MSFDSQAARQDSLIMKNMRWWQVSQTHNNFDHKQVSSTSSFLSKFIINNPYNSPQPPNPPSKPNFTRNPSSCFKLQQPGGITGLQLDEDDQQLNVSAPALVDVPPAVTVVLEGRSICHRICLHKHDSYRSLARALRNMFVDKEIIDHGLGHEKEKDDNIDLSNAIPGHLVAYEDMENDLLLAGDLNWTDFVRVARRIRILPAKSNPRKDRGRLQAVRN